MSGLAETLHRRRLALGVLVFAALFSAFAWWLRAEIGFRWGERVFTAALDRYSDWDGACAPGAGVAIRAGARLMQPDALACRLDTVMGDRAPGAAPQEATALAARLFVMTRDPAWLAYRPCPGPWPAAPSALAFEVNQAMTNAAFLTPYAALDPRAADLDKPPDDYRDASEAFFNCAFTGGDPTAWIER